MGIFRNSSTSVIFAKLVNPLLCFVIILFILYIGQHVLIPLFFSFLLAVLLTSLCSFLEKVGLSRGLASLISLLLAVIVFFVVFYFISSSIVSFKNDFPVMMQNMQQAINNFELWLQKRFHLSTQKVQDLMDSSSNILPTTAVIVNKTLSAVSGAFFVGIIVFLQTFLLLFYRSLLVKFLVSLFAEEFSSHVYHIINRTRYVIRNYIIGLFIEMLVVAVAYCGLLFILGVKYALLLGVLGAILNLIPYVGIFIACILTVLVTFTTNTTSTVIWSVIGILAIHLTDANVLLPKIVGSKVKINALATILGVIIGSAVWGIPGMFLAVPTIAILKVIFEDIPAFQPFAIILDDDAEHKSTTKPALKKLAKRVAAMKTKKHPPTA